MCSKWEMEKSVLSILSCTCPILLCKAVRYYSSFILMVICLGINFTAFIYIYMVVLQYTTACLQVLFSSQHLGGTAKVLQ